MRDTAKKLEQLNTLIELSFLINSTLDTSEIRKWAIEASVRLLGAETGSLLLVDQESGALFFEVALGDKGDIVKEVSLMRGQGIAGWVAEKGEALILHDVQSDSRFYRVPDMKSKFITKNMICVPLRSKERTIGVLEAINKKHGVFSDEDKEVLVTLANQVAIAIENANLYQELKDTFYGTIEALAETIEKRDPYTGGHTKRVRDYSLMIGRRLGLPKKEIEDLRLAAVLHDIGKIGVRDDVLLKKDKLNPEEFDKMSMHSAYGAAILEHIKHLHDVIPAVRSHHERVDGTGYPDRLKGQDIPLAAKIISAADTFDAMTTDRPYRNGLSVEKAFEELRLQSGTQFDTLIVDALYRLFMREKGKVCRRKSMKMPAITG